MLPVVLILLDPPPLFLAVFFPFLPPRMSSHHTPAPTYCKYLTYCFHTSHPNHCSHRATPCPFSLQTCHLHNAPQELVITCQAPSRIYSDLCVHCIATCLSLPLPNDKQVTCLSRVSLGIGHQNRAVLHVCFIFLVFDTVRSPIHVLVG